MPARRTTDSIVRLLRQMPSGLPGKARVARMLLRDDSVAVHGTVSDRFGFRYEMPDMREPIAFHLAVDAVYEPETLAVILKALQPSDVFVDVGANIGVFTLPAAQRVGPAGRVLAAEASPEIFGYLQRNVTLSRMNHVTCIHCAVCASAGWMPFYCAPDLHFGMGSLGPQFSATPIKVPGKTLDDIISEAGIERVDLLKVDVEGFEVSVFQGARRLLTRRDAPLIVFEFCDWAEARVPHHQIGDAQRLLLGLGFSIWRLADYRRNRKPLYGPLTVGFEMLIACRI